MFSLEWFAEGKYNDTIGEIRIDYHNDKPFEEFVSAFMSFLKEHQEQRVVLCSEELDPLEIPAFVHFLEMDNWVIEFMRPINIETLAALKKYHIPFFIKYFASSWDEFTSIANTGVTDIYVAGELGFCLDKIHAVAGARNIKVRVVPNLAQGPDNCDNIRHFFIRPEGMSLYAQYVDVFEFVGVHMGKDAQPAEQEVMYEIYTSGKWFGTLDEIIMGLGVDLDSKTLLKRWDEKRINCDKKCLKGSSCNFCNVAYALSKNFQEVKVILKEDAEKSQEQLDEEALLSKYEELRTKLENFSKRKEFVDENEQSIRNKIANLSEND